MQQKKGEKKKKERNRTSVVASQSSTEAFGQSQTPEQGKPTGDNQAALPSARDSTHLIGVIYLKPKLLRTKHTKNKINKK